MLTTTVFSVFSTKKGLRKRAFGPHTAKYTLRPLGPSRTPCLTKCDDVGPFHGPHYKGHSPALWACAGQALASASRASEDYKGWNLSKLTGIFKSRICQL